MPSAPVRGDRRRRRAVVPEIAVRVVLDDRHAGIAAAARGELGAPARADRAAARVLEVRQRVEEARAGGARRELAGQRPAVVAGDADELGLVRNERLQRAEVGRRLDGDAAAGVDQHLADEVEPLLRAGRDQHLRRAHRDALARHLGGDPFAQRREAFARGVLQRLARRVAQHPRRRLAHRLDRKGVGRGQAAGERDDPRQLGELQDLADRRRVHSRGAGRELPKSRRKGRCHRILDRCRQRHPRSAFQCRGEARTTSPRRALRALRSRASPRRPSTRDRSDRRTALRRPSRRCSPRRRR